MIASIRRRVAGATSVRPLITLDTVGTDTPARSATSAIVVRAGGLEAWLVTMARSIGPKVSREAVIVHVDAALNRGG